MDKVWRKGLVWKRRMWMRGKEQVGKEGSGGEERIRFGMKDQVEREG